MSVCIILHWMVFDRKFLLKVFAVQKEVFLFSSSSFLLVFFLFKLFKLEQSPKDLDESTLGPFRRGPLGVFNYCVTTH